MQIKFFTIPIKQADEAEQEVNRFLASHRILNTDRRFVENGENSFWTLAAEYLTGEAGGTEKSKSGKANRVDYKEVLSPEDFEVFSRLREVRKQIANEESIPVYTVFTNEQLAKIVTEKVDSKAAMGKIPGVGEATVEKYAERILREAILLRVKGANMSVEKKQDGQNKTRGANRPNRLNEQRLSGPGGVTWQRVRPFCPFHLCL